MSGFANKLTSAETERLVMLMEECAEVQQAAAKVLRHGYESRHPDGGPTNREHLTEELVDVMSVMSAMCRTEDVHIHTEFFDEVANPRWQKKLKFTHHQAGDFK